jgi:glyoxylase-like metal-dependent hydrolase (beta-lactamase superfamily II)
LGIAPESIKTILISHFHGDHIAGLKDFPQAQVICSASALQQAISLKGWAAVGSGILPDLLPPDLVQRTTQIPDAQLGNLQEDASAYDLWGDGSMRLIALPGHGRGQLGAVLQTPEGEVFLAADAAWQFQPWRAGILPRSIVRLFFDDWRAYQQTFFALQDYADRHPDCKILFTHSLELVLSREG